MGSLAGFSGGIEIISAIIYKINSLILALVMLTGGVSSPSVDDKIFYKEDDVKAMAVIWGDTQICNYNPEREISFVAAVRDLQNSAYQIDALLIDITNIGISNDTICITCFASELSLKSTPLDAWAFKIFSVSANSVGINLKAIDNIIAKILVFIFKSSSGFKIHSIALDISIGLVVKVNTVEKLIIIITLKTVNEPNSKP